MMSHNDAETALLAGFLCLAVDAAGDGSSARASARVSEQSPPAGLIERGRYLVHNVAMCVQCHSPRDENGELIETALLTGAPMPVKSPFPNRIWATRTPSLRGLSFLSEANAMRLLREGIAHTGKPPDPPMPPFRMTPEDASAVIAYLKSLK